MILLLIVGRGETFSKDYDQDQEHEQEWITSPVTFDRLTQPDPVVRLFHEKVNLECSGWGARSEFGVGSSPGG
ncbi:MAG TPA: hypothetical protein VF511_01750 [Chthoniobacterales bacterium]